MITQQEHEEAERRGREALRTAPRALSARYDKGLNQVVIELNTGYSVSFPPSRSEELCHVSLDVLEQVEIDYPGFSIYFPRADAGLLVSSIAQGRFGSDRWEAAWLAAHPLEQAPFPLASASSEEHHEAA